MSDFNFTCPVCFYDKCAPNYCWKCGWNSGIADNKPDNWTKDQPSGVARSGNKIIRKDFPVEDPDYGEWFPPKT